MADFSLFAFAELRECLREIETCRLLLPRASGSALQLLGTDADRALRNRLLGPWLAKQCREWLLAKVEVKEAPAPLPQCLIAAKDAASNRQTVLVGNCPFSSEGLGLAVGNQFGLVQVCERDDECEMFRNWFAGIWQSCPAGTDARERLLNRLAGFADAKAPALVYYL